MKRALKLSTVLLAMTTLLTGCIIWPGYWEDGGHHGGGYGHHGGWHGERR